MFTLQNWKVKLTYAGFGSLFGSLCTIMGMLASPVTAQRDKFGDIECTSLTVVDADGDEMVTLGGGNRLGQRPGGNVTVYDEDGKQKVWLFAETSGGSVVIWHKGGTAGQVHLSTNKYGGVVSVSSTDGILGVTRVALSVNKYGGRIGVSGIGEGRAVMAINEYGNGDVSTWDKNGYRQ